MLTKSVRVAWPTGLLYVTRRGNRNKSQLATEWHSDPVPRQPFSESNASVEQLDPPVESALPARCWRRHSQISIAVPGGIAFISGQVAWSRNGSPPPTTFPEPAALVVRIAKKALRAIGATGKALLMVRAYVVDLTEESVAELWPHLHALFDGAQPSLTGIGVAALAAKNLLLEIEMTVSFRAHEQRNPPEPAQ